MRFRGPGALDDRRLHSKSPFKGIGVPGWSQGNSLETTAFEGHRVERTKFAGGSCTRWSPATFPAHYFGNYRGRNWKEVRKMYAPRAILRQVVAYMLMR
jgi:hypothetical protein